MDAPKLFYKKTGYGFDVEIWSAKECHTDKPFTLARYVNDIEALVASLKKDEQFLRLTEGKTDSEIRFIVEIILCHDLRLTTQKYGVGHN